MTRRPDLMEIERTGWEALATSGEAAAAYYDDVLAERVLFLLPGGMVIDERGAAIDSMRGEPWSSYELSDDRVAELGDDAAVLAYRARAVRGGQEYSAVVSSTFVREHGVWKLAVHQQTPV